RPASPLKYPIFPLPTARLPTRFPYYRTSRSLRLSRIMEQSAPWALFSRKTPRRIPPFNPFRHRPDGPAELLLLLAAPARSPVPELQHSAQRRPLPSLWCSPSLRPPYQVRRSRKL